MNLKKFGLKVLSVAIAMVMLMSVCAPVAISAAELGEKNEINYVSIGDSMTNGYGFEGYRQGDYEVGDSFLTGEGVYGEGSYALQFENWLKEQNPGYTVNHTKLAVSALRAEDLNFLLGGREMPTDGWFEQVKNYSGISDEEQLSEIYVNAVENADIITLCIGNASFGAYMVQYITRALGVMGGSLAEDEIVTLDMALALLDSEEAKELVIDVYESMKEKLVDLVPAAVLEMYAVEKLDMICEAVAYIAAGFLINYESVIDQIAKLNPNCEIILIGLMNTTYGMEITADGMDSIAFGDAMDEVFNLLNAYIASVPSVKQIMGECEDITFYYAAQPKPDFIVMAFDDLAANNWENVDGGRLSGKIVRSRSIKAYNENLRPTIGAAFGFNLPVIDIDDVANYTFREGDQYNAGAEFTAQLTAFLSNGAIDPSPYPLVAEYLTAGYTDFSVGNITAFLAPRTEKEISIAIYLAIEEAVVNSVDTLEITLDGLKGIAGGGDSIFAALGTMPEGLKPEKSPGPTTIKNLLVQWFSGSDTGRAMCKIYGLFKIGDGMSVHPTPTGHDDLAKAIIDAYKNGYTANDETFKTVKEALELLADLVANYYDEAYAYGYAYAVENGYVAMAEAAIDDAMAAIAAIEVDNELIDAELKAALEAELTAVFNTLFELKVAVTTNKAGTVEGLVEVVFALEDDLYAHLANAEAILLLAGEDVYEQALAQIAILKNKIETEVIPQIEAYVNAMLLKAQDYIVTKIAEAFGIVVDVKDSIEEKLAKICAYIEAVYGIVLDTQATVEATIENTIKAICGYIADIYNIALDVKATAMEMVQQIYNYFAKLYGDSVAAFDKAVEAFREYLAKTHTCEYLVSDDSYYVAIDGNYYANILAEKLNLTEEQVKLVTWDELTVEDIAKADLITIGYDNNTVLAFAAEQLLGYTKNYIDGTLRNDAKEYLNDVLVSLELLKAEAIENVIGNVDTAIDYIIMEEPVASMGVTALDWAALIGEENSEYVANVKAEIANALAEAGIPATYEVPVPVVEMLYEYRAELGLEELFNFVDVDTLYKKLGENAYYTLEIPVMDMMVFAAESAVYEYVRYNKNYSETIAAINMINPDAAVALLGSYNLFDGIDFGVDNIGVEAVIDVAELIKLVGFDKFIGEEYAIDTVEISAIFTVDEIYDAFAIASSVQPMAYAAMYENVFFVDIRDVETNLEEAIAYEFLDGSILSILEGYLFGIDTEPSVAGNEYIAEQIYNALIVTCDHIYDDVCVDVDCNRCGEIREASGHSFTNYVSNGDATCTADGTKTAVCDNGCGEEDTIADEGSKLAHKFVTYTSNGDATCNSDGTKTASCEYGCGAKDTIADEGSKLTHKFVTYTSNGDATCNSDGTKTASCANGCGAKDTIVDEGTKLTHKFVTYVSDGNATCTSDGTKTATCANGCGARDTVIDTGSMKIHNYVLVVDHTDATCVVAESTTLRCGTCPATTVVVGELGEHVPGEAATCTTAQVCTVCNAEVAAATGHTPGAAATCTTAQTCTVCNAEVAAATGHKAGAAATCTTAQTCTVCKVELVAATGHKAGAAATCTAAQTCTVCNAELAAATAHNFADATCKAPKTCTVCNATEGEAAAHTYANACDVDCDVCGATRTTEHTYGDWTVTVEPTAKADGKQERTCTGCGAVDSEVVPATGSALSVGVIVGIVVAALAVVGGGVFVVLFLLKKKRA